MKILLTLTLLLGMQSLHSQEFDSARIGTFASFFFTGQFSDEDAAGASGSIKGSSQKSFSLGVTNTYRLAKDKQLLWNLYLSKYLNTEVEFTAGASETLKYPTEFGTAFHYRQALSNPAIFLYGGADFESLSFLNLAPYLAGTGPLAFSRFSIFYATLGAGYTFFLGEKIVNFKAQLSQTLTSSSNTTNDIKAKGQKYHLMALLRPGPESRLFYDTFISRYQLKRETSGSLTRIGIGVNYLFQ